MSGLPSHGTHAGTVEELDIVQTSLKEFPFESSILQE